MLYCVKLDMAPIISKLEVQETLSSRVNDAVRILRDGGVVAIPTDTVYGLAAAFDDEEAIERIFRIKGRSADVAIPLLLDDPRHANRYLSTVPDAFPLLADAFWPGPLTVILSKNRDVSARLTGGRNTIGLRVPDHWVPRQIAESLGKAITGTSANISSTPSLTTAQEVEEQLGKAVDLVVDGGPVKHAIGSTVVDISGVQPELLREGRIPFSEIKRVLYAEVAVR